MLDGDTEKVLAEQNASFQLHLLFLQCTLPSFILIPRFCGKHGFGKPAVIECSPRFGHRLSL